MRSVKHNIMNILLRAWRGEERLWVVFWIYNLLFSFVLNWYLDNVQISVESGFFVYWFIPCVAVYIAWISVSLWRCAFNVSFRFVGYAVRFSIILPIVFIVIVMAGL